MNTRKAMVVGIDEYRPPLYGCCNDAEAIADILSKNEDGSKNFSVELHKNVMTKGELLSHIKRCFEGDCETALLFFSGHGHIAIDGGYLVTPDYSQDDWGVSLQSVLSIATRSSCKNKVIILDCCHSGSMGEITTLGENNAVIGEGMTVLSSSRRHEPSLETNGHGVFTSLLLEALRGCAADVTGYITPGSIYSYVDKALGPWGQRPVFKTNVNSFVSLRSVTPAVQHESLRQNTSLFSSEDECFKLDPSFEPTNSPDVEHKVVEPFALKENTEKLAVLQQYEGAGLVRPLGADHMYYAAMQSKACCLTELGKQYWRLISSEMI